ncbi:MAG: SDR family NAD(P)-dependent oxidoreductase [Clostridia bacterium]|nr:SDR family NAD(P)-dependent oxidoreductase [Clostridia bacterium]
MEKNENQQDNAIKEEPLNVEDFLEPQPQPKKDEGFALITGATGGLGKAFVYALARRGYKLLLTGRSAEKLHGLQDELANVFPQVETRTYAADLSNGQSRAQLMEQILKDGATLSFLANVAGADIQKGLTEYTDEKIAFQCRVNFEAAVALCRFAIENKAERLKIVNVSSVSGIYPMPYFAIYSATKGALTSFSVALREEMRKKGVSVTAVLPGAMPTRDDVKEQIKGQGLWGKLAAKSPEAVAEISIKAVEKNKRKIIVGFWNKMMRVFTAWLPASWRLRFIAKRWSKISKDAF